MGVHHVFYPGHPESMGAVERWNRTLKDMLSKNVQEHGSGGISIFPHLVVIHHYRNTPQYNRHVAIPISIRTFAFGTHISSQKEVWVGERKNIPTTLSRSVEKSIWEDLIEKLKKGS
ncbi:retrovirus-related Pol polyprotein from transposon opus [Trichonephila clavipes]|nr:retrovirus-related Pol polyprotein from transposon opus [Trichonephila clavipes]